MNSLFKRMQESFNRIYICILPFTTYGKVLTISLSIAVICFAAGIISTMVEITAICNTLGGIALGVMLISILVMILIDDVISAYDKAIIRLDNNKCVSFYNKPFDHIDNVEASVKILIPIIYLRKKSLMLLIYLLAYVLLHISIISILLKLGALC